MGMTHFGVPGGEEEGARMLSPGQQELQRMEKDTGDFCVLQGGKEGGLGKT